MHKMTAKKKNIYEEITQRLIEYLERGTLPWRKTWKQGVPRNYMTKRLYSGINFLKLSLNDFPTPYYLTYLQCKQLDGYVLKGEKAQSIIFWKPYVVEKELPDGDTEKKVIPLYRVSSVFNLSQTSLYREPEVKSENQVIAKCKSLEERIRAKIEIKRNFNRCYYSPKNDYISIPLITDFNTEAEYYSALFHEAAHATGHSKRLDRNLDYETEELVAEITASYLCAYCGIEAKTIENNAAYISSWLKQLKEDYRFIAKISNYSKQAAEYLLY